MEALTAIVPATDCPATLAGVVAAIRAAAEPPEEVIVVAEPRGAGPAAARNAGARQATGGILVFVDADVEVHRDAFALIRRAFAADGGLTALFGSYDDDPRADGIVSAFRNLLHHHVHHEGAGPATTFWAGLGAVRRDAFLDAGGFDEGRFPRPSIEDVDLGARLSARGARIVLDPRVQGTHLKRWTLASMIRTDLFDRGLPWIELMLERRGPATSLNLGWRHRLSALASLALVVSLLRGRWRRALASLGALTVLNRSFYGLLVRRRGSAEAAAGVGLHVVHHLTGAAALAAGVLRRLRSSG